jgi:hypothetical protein
MSSPNRCLDLWREAVKLRDKCCCQSCGKAFVWDGRGGLHAHHIHYQSQQCWWLLYVIDLGDSLCSECHTAAHAEKSAYRDKLAARVEIDRWRRICALLETVKQTVRDKPDYQEIAKGLRTKIKTLREEYEDWLVSHDPDPYYGR